MPERDSRHTVMPAVPRDRLGQPPSGFGTRAQGRGLTPEHAGQIVPGGGSCGARRDYLLAKIVC